MAYTAVEGFRSLGIGLGQQDLMTIEGDEQVMFGIGSVVQIATNLDVADPKFDQKCRARGIDPDEVRKSIDSGEH